MARVAIVTGGTRGIGEAICLRLHKQGHSVIANYGGNEEKAKAFTARTGIPSIRWDVGDHEACIHNCNDIAAEYGPVDIVINNAGITRDGVLHKMSFDDWNEVMRINLGGCFNMAKATFPGMRERGWGRIVNIGSINGQAGQYGRSTMPPPNRASTALPRRWRRKAPNSALPSMRLRPAISLPIWSPPGPLRCWKRSSPRSRSGGWAMPKKSPARSPS